MTASVNVGIRSLLNIVPRTPRHATTTQQSLSSSADCHDDERHERRTTRAYRDPKQYTHKFKDEAPRRIPGDGGRRRGRGRRRRFEGHRHRGESGESRVWCGVVWCGRAGRGGIRSFRASTSSGGDGAGRGRSGLRIRHFRLGLSPPLPPPPIPNPALYDADHLSPFRPSFSSPCLVLVPASSSVDAPLPPRPY